MEKEIEDIIKKNLPAQVGETLKKTLEQAEKDAIKVKDQEQIISNKSAEIIKLNGIVADYKAFDDRNLKLESREQVVADKERNLEIEHLKINLKAEQDKSKFTESVAMGLVRNTSYRKSIYDNETSQGYYNSQGVFVPPNSQTKNHTETNQAD